MTGPRALRVLVARVALGVFVLPSASDASRPPARPWPHEHSDLAPYASIQFGHLDNGVRYAWRRWSDPSDEVYAWLDVRCGSAMEADDELGLAHTVEHLVLRRCGDRKSGDLRRWAEQHGMTFGPDLNGFTSYLDTRYLLHLFHCDDALLRECLSALRDLAVDGRFDDAEIAIERGVIDAEESTDQDADQSRDRAVWRFFHSGSPLAERHPLGVRSVRDRFTAQKVERFYRRWYVPENFTLVVVGDLHGDPKAAIEAIFGALEPRPSPVAPVVTGLEFPSAPFVHRDSRLDAAEVELRRVVEAPFQTATLRSIADGLPAVVAVIALHRRLELLPERLPDDLYGVAVRRLVPSPSSPVRGLEVDVGAPLDRWPQAVHAVANELARVLRDGFTADEVRAAAASHRRWFAIEGDHDRTRLSGEKCDCMLDAADDGDEAFDFAAIGERLDAALAKLTADECRRALAAEWEGGRPQSAISLREGDATAIAKSLERSLVPDAAPKDAAPAEPRATSFVYAAPPKKAGVQTGRRSLGSGVEEVDFQNGVRVHLFRQESGRVEVRAIFGEGLGSVTPPRRWMPGLVDELFTDMGLGRHSAPEWRQLLADHDVRLHFDVTSSAFQLGGNCASADLRLESQLIAAHLADPGFRRAPLVRLKHSYPSWYESLQRDPRWTLATTFLPELLHEDRLRRVATPADVASLDLDALRAWLEPQVTKSRLQVVMWGGFDLDEAIAIAADTFGALPARARERAAAPRTEHAPASGVRREYTLGSGAKQAGVHVLFPTGSHFRDERSFFELELLSRIYEDRLLRSTREELGLTYAPRAYATSDHVIAAWGWLGTSIELAPGLEDRVAKLAVDVAASLAKEGVTEEELARLRLPAIQEHDDREFHERLTLFFDVDDALDRFAHERDVLATATKAELDALAARYLSPTLADVAVVHAPAKKRM